MMSHTACDHPATPAARSKCRRANGLSTPRTERATPRALNFKDVDKEEHPTDPARCCMNCKLRKREWRGTHYLTGRLMDVCNKCLYVIVLSNDYIAIEV